MASGWKIMFSSRVMILNKNTPMRMQQYILISLILEMVAIVEPDNVKNKLAAMKDTD
jgi:hypothetical protein